ncbi:MAG: FtsW/RodA/SpoVE family cell cycle protein [Actinobacteria bacterium]|nr:FtsW/RodA/SpoVE family cell cycle protein [Actinomycetota bacterium]
MSARNRELFGLLPVALAVAAGFAGVLITREAEVNDATLTYGLAFLVFCLVGHLFVRWRLPDADPYIYPLAAALAGVGIVMVYRIDPELAREQAQWFVFGLAAFVAVGLLLRDLSLLERYRYTIAAGAMVLLIMPRLTGGVTNGAYLRIDLGPVEFQPAELAKIAVVIFVAAYLADTRELMVTYERRFLGVSLPPLRYFGPMLVVWAIAMLLLVFIRDLGSSVMFFGGFLALLYVATGRLSYVVLGLAMFVVGFLFFESTVGHVGARVDAWRNPLDPDLYYALGGSGQIAQGMFAQADGGVLGAGLGQSILTAGGDPVLPAAQTDLIYAVVVNELGFVGAVALLLVYLLFVQRGLKTAMLATDPFNKLLAAGLTAVFALQVFVIVGGVTRVIPLTGVTLPFVSYGGSSIVANFVLVGLLMVVSDGARRRHREGGLL